MEQEYENSVKDLTFERSALLIASNKEFFSLKYFLQCLDIILEKSSFLDVLYYQQELINEIIFYDKTS
jgi:hypothetical protein